MIIIFLILNFLTFGYSVSFANSIDSTTFRDNPNYIQELSLFEVYRTEQADIVLLGDSNIKGADWGELLGRKNVISRGVVSDVIEGYIARLNFVFNLEPKVVIINGGLNDVYSWIPVEKIFQNYVQLIELIKKKNITVVVQSTFHVITTWPQAEDRNKEIDKLNLVVEEYCKKNKIPFLNLTPMMSRNGAFKLELTNSWGHINGRGYKIWANELDKLLLILGH